VFVCLLIIYQLVVLVLKVISSRVVGFTSTYAISAYRLNGDEIDEIDNHCHLRITFQSSATWKKHIDDIYKKARSRLLLLRQVKNTIFFSFFED
jgi:hypothetical protein